MVPPFVQEYLEAVYEPVEAASNKVLAVRSEGVKNISMVLIESVTGMLKPAPAFVCNPLFLCLKSGG